MKNICIEEKVIIRLTFNPGLALTAFDKIIWDEPAIQSKTDTSSADIIQTHVTSMGSLNLNLRYGRMMLVSGYLVFTVVN